MDYQHILFSIGNGIATITFNRPKALNALNEALLGEMLAVLEDIESNPDIRVLILTGAGDKAFVAGADITELARRLNAISAKTFAEMGHKVMNKLQELPIPVIAAVNGFALGGGSEIALACDFIYASENAKFGLPEITLGLIPGFGGTQRLARRVGKNVAKEMIFTGKMISANEAREIGMVNRVVSPESLMEAVQKTAGMIASKGRVSTRAAKQAINNGMDVDLANGCKLEIDAFSICMAGVDAKEGTSAFLEKRKPIFTGDLNQ